MAATLALGFTPARAQCPTDQLCVCDGDCLRDGEVDIIDLQGCVNGFIGAAFCPECDADLDGEVGIVDLQGAVNGFLDSTVCPTITLANLAVGSTNGPRGGQVTVPITLTSQVADVVTIAPLRLSFNSNALTLVGCTSTVSSKTVVAESPSAGSLSLVLYANPFDQPPQGLTPIPVGPVANCSFGIKAAAPTGPSAVAFVAAGLSDSTFRDFTATGSDGVVTIQ